MPFEGDVPGRAPAWTTMRMLIMVVVLAAACGGAEAAGEMLTVLHDQATVDGDAVADGDAIPALATVATDADGVARFRLTVNGLNCHMFQDAVVNLLDRDALLRFERGETICTAASAGGRELKVETEQFDLTFTEARFGVDLTGEQPAVLIEEGRVAIDSFAGAERRWVERTIVNNDDDPLEPSTGATQSDAAADEDGRAPADDRWRMTVVLYRSDGSLGIRQRVIDPDAPGQLVRGRPLSAEEVGAFRWVREVQLTEMIRLQESTAPASASSDAPTAPGGATAETSSPSPSEGSEGATDVVSEPAEESTATTDLPTDDATGSHGAGEGSAERGSDDDADASVDDANGGAGTTDAAGGDGAPSGG